MVFIYRSYYSRDVLSTYVMWINVLYAFCNINYEHVSVHFLVSR